MPKKETRCWPGYEPVKGKKKNEQGSCRPKAESKLASGEKDFRSKRERQLDRWKDEHPGSPKKAAQHLSAPGVKKKAATKKKTATKKKPAAKRKATPRKKAA